MAGIVPAVDQAEHPPPVEPTKPDIASTAPQDETRKSTPRKLPASEQTSTTATLPPRVAYPHDTPTFVAQYVIRKHLDKPVSFTANDKPESIDTPKPWEAWLVYGAFTADGKMSSYSCMVRMSERNHFVIGYLNIDGIPIQLGEGREFTLNDIDLIQTSEPAKPSEPAHEFGSLHARRTWTSSGGSFSVEATFVSSSGDKVKLRKTDGKSITIELKKLSDDDQKYVRDLGR